MTPPAAAPSEAGNPAGPLHLAGEVLSVSQVGAYTSLTLLAPGIHERFEPGHFVALGVGGPETSMLLRRSFSIYRVRDRGAYGATVEVVFAVTGKGTAWLAERRPHDPVDVVGPLGRPFPLPSAGVSATLVGGGYGSAPLFPLGERLRARGARVDFVLGAATEERLLGVLDAKRGASTVEITTDDGSVGTRGRVSDVLPSVLERTGADVVYACGPMPMLAAVAEQAAAHGAASFTAVEEAMACGIGVCMTCVLPVAGEDGVIRMLRACTEGPVFRGDLVRWADVGSIPDGTYGASE